MKRTAKGLLRHIRDYHSKNNRSMVFVDKVIEMLGEHDPEISKGQTEMIEDLLGRIRMKIPNNANRQIEQTKEEILALVANPINEVVAEIKNIP